MQPLTATPRLAKPPFDYQTARTDRHCISEKQPAKADHLSVACFNLVASLFMQHSVHSKKIKSADMGDKTDFLRSSHIPRIRTRSTHIQFTDFDDF